jgi:hypothetical protein
MITHDQQQAIDAYCQQHDATWLGCMENDDEFMFKVPMDSKLESLMPYEGGKMHTAWWLAAEKRVGTFQEYLIEP